MISLLRMGITFLKKSKILTFSAFISIFMACFLSVSMFQLSGNAWTAYRDNILEEYGDYQIGISKNDGMPFSAGELEYISNCKDVTKISYGYYNADLDGIYVVGVHDDDINKSRYKYSCHVRGKDIVINECLSNKSGKEIGDRLSVRGQDYTVKEILEKDPFSEYGMRMIIMDMMSLHELLGNDAGQPNYIMLQIDDNADAGVIQRKLSAYNPEFIVYGVETSSDVQKILSIFEGMIRVLFVFVIMISSMFILSIFQEFMRKYRRDMAIIRAVGGKKKQVSIIFMCMCLSISFFGCMAAALASILFDDILLNLINKRINLFDGNVVIDYAVLTGMSAAVFVLFNVIVGVFFVLKQNVLPIQVFEETGSGLRKSRISNRLPASGKIPGIDGYFGIKLLVPKFCQNIMIIIIIALITAFSYTGQSSMELLIRNSLVYINEAVQGFDAYGNVQASGDNEYLEPDDVAGLEDMISGYSSDYVMIYQGFYEYYRTLDGRKLGGFSVTDMDSFMSAVDGKRIDNWESIPKNQRMVMTGETAEYTGYEPGDKVTLDTEWLGDNQEYTLAGITEWESGFSTEDEGVYVDRDNLVWLEEKASEYGAPYCVEAYINGDSDELRELSAHLDKQYPDSKWMIYDDYVKQIYTVSNQRNAMIKLVMLVLMFVAGIGWLNSARGILLARKHEYQVLRMLGASQKRVKRICYIQVLIYMSAGIILGSIIGIVTVYGIWNSNLNAGVSVEIFWGYIAGIVLYMIVLASLLVPTVRKICDQGF